VKKNSVAETRAARRDYLHFHFPSFSDIAAILRRYFIAAILPPPFSSIFIFRCRRHAGFLSLRHHAFADAGCFRYDFHCWLLFFTSIFIIA